MKAQIQEQEQTTAEIIPGTFPLSSEPVDIQLTIHLNNYLQTFRSAGAALWKVKLQNPEKPSPVLMIDQIVSHYGIDRCRNFFSLIYGWNFVIKKSVNKTLTEKVG